MEYKVIKAVNPRDPKGKKVYRAKLVKQRGLNYDDLTLQLVRGNKKWHLMSRQILMMLRFLVAQEMREGREVRIEDFGTFYPSVKSVNKDSKRKAGDGAIKAIKIGFRPAGWLKK
ncbi:MAG: hypothetical protein FJY07_09195, partial [Bacteroidetes bacterium]|nr:hypothetical protein [Bacteroidota bacterium]